MEKPADTAYPIHALLRRRWSPVAFSERLIAREDLRAILEAGRWAPSCYNAQPWHFILATREQPDEFARVLICLTEKNGEWAQHAAVVMLSVARLGFAHNGKPNRHAQHDIGLAVENMVIQAMSLGIFAHQMAGIFPDKAREVFSIPEGYEALTGIVMGYPSSAEGISDELKARQNGPRSRKPLSDYVFSGTWGTLPEILGGIDPKSKI